MSNTNFESRRSVICNEEIMRIQMKKLGITATSLALAIDVDPRTIYRALAGEPKDIETVRKIATVLKVTYDDLVNGIYPQFIPEEHDDSDDRTETVITIRGIIDHLEVGRRIEILQAVIDTKHPITDLRTEFGSTRLICQMRRSDVLRLIAGMLDGRLALLDVSSIKIADHSWIMRSIALIKVLGTPVQPDDEAWADLLNSHQFDFLKNRASQCFLCAEPPIPPFKAKPEKRSLG